MYALAKKASKAVYKPGSAKRVLSAIEWANRMRARDQYRPYAAHQVVAKVLGYGSPRSLFGFRLSINLPMSAFSICSRHPSVGSVLLFFCKLFSSHNSSTSNVFLMKQVANDFHAARERSIAAANLTVSFMVLAIFSKSLHYTDL